MSIDKKLPLPIQTLFSEVEQRAQDADFTETFERPGSFKKRKRNNRYYWYWQYRKGSKVVEKYVGPVTNKEITDRVNRFYELKNDFDERRRLVNTLTSAGLPKTDPLTGSIIEAMAQAGFFRLRGVLVGTTAYQCYSGILGTKLSSATLRTQDADLAQYFAISQEIKESIPPVLDILKPVDETFREVPSIDSKNVTAYKNSQGYRVEFLTPNRGSNEYQSKPAQMPALGGASAQPLRFLDFLIYSPIRSVLLFEAGIPVTIPSPERYLIHKLIVATRRHEISRSKANKDTQQATTLINAMSEQYATAISECWQEAWQRGPKWREALEQGLDQLTQETRDKLEQAVIKGAKRRKQNHKDFWSEG